MCLPLRCILVADVFWFLLTDAVPPKGLKAMPPHSRKQGGDPMGDLVQKWLNSHGYKELEEADETLYKATTPMADAGDTIVKVSDSGGEGIIQGWAARYGNVDRHADIIAAGAMKAGIGRKKTKVPFFAHHSVFLQLGSAILEEKDDGIWYEARVALNSPSRTVRERAEEYYYLARDGHLDKNSIGFIAPRKYWEFEEKVIDGEPEVVRVLKRIEPIEVSMVPIPANPKADIESVKMLHPDEKAASGSTDLPLADRSTGWDGDAARRELAKWASTDGSGDKDKVNWAKYRRGFFWVDENNRENFGGYKLPFARPINGRLMAIPNGIFAAAAAVQGARGGVDIPSDDLPAVRRKIAAYYRKMGETPPWDKNKDDKASEPMVSKQKMLMLVKGLI